MSEAFDPAQFLSKVSGQDYLEVKYRLLWLRTEHPNAIIVTEIVRLDDSIAVFKATVEIPTTPDGEGGGIGTGHGSEQYGDFRDFIEKAETKAIGRALGSLGYGTQFSKEFDFGADQNRVVDAPVDLQRQRTQRTSSVARAASNERAARDTSSDAVGRSQTFDNARNASNAAPAAQPATARQHSFIGALQTELDISDDALKLECEASFGCKRGELSRRDASVLIERLQQRRAEINQHGTVEFDSDTRATQPTLVDRVDTAANARS
jgi:hypothetical protein